MYSLLREIVGKSLLLLPLFLLVLSLIFQPRVELYDQSTMFSGEEAYKLLKVIVGKYSYRVVGSEPNREIAYWIRGYFEELGFEANIQVFETRDFSGRLVKAYNVYGIKRGLGDQYIVIVAHHDTVPWTVEGANDNGGGVAVLMELAYIFANKSTLANIVFLSTDAEEVGLVGSEYFIRNFEYREKIIAAISIDMCSWREAESIMLGSFFGYRNPFRFSDGGLLYLFMKFEKFGYRIEVTIPYIASRIYLVPGGTDSMPFIDYGVPATGIGDYPLYPYWHTREDTLDKISATRLEEIGSLIERVLLTIDRNGGFPILGQHVLFIDQFVITENFMYTIYVSGIFYVIYHLFRSPRRKIIDRRSIIYISSVLSYYIIAILLSLYAIKSGIDPFLVVVIGIPVSLATLAAISRLFYTRYIALKTVNIILGTATYFAGVLNPSVGILFLSPLLYLPVFSRPLDRRTNVIIPILALLVSFAPEISVIILGVKIIGYNSFVRYLQRILTYLFFKKYLLIAFTIYTSMIFTTVTISIATMREKSEPT